MPDRGIDPIMEGVHFADDVQTVISRQKDPQQFGVVTIGAFNGGTVANVIPDHADLQLTLRSFTPEVRKILNDGVAATANASAEMAHAPAPDVKHMFGVGSVNNDETLAAQSAAVLTTALGAKNVELQAAYKPGMAGGEDFAEFIDAGVSKSVFFIIGGDDPTMLAAYKAQGKLFPVNHSPYFAPLPEPSIRTGVETLTLAVLMVAPHK